MEATLESHLDSVKLLAQAICGTLEEEMLKLGFTTTVSSSSFGLAASKSGCDTVTLLNIALAVLGNGLAHGAIGRNLTNLDAAKVAIAAENL